MGKRVQQVHSITSVQRALSEDVDDRAKRYLISMLIRTACIVLAVVLPDPWRWIAAAGAVFVPMLAVMVANAGRELSATDTNVDPRALSPAPKAGPPPPQTPSHPDRHD